MFVHPKLHVNPKPLQFLSVVPLGAQGYKQLLAYAVNRLPKKDHWVVVDGTAPTLYFRQAMDVSEEGHWGQLRALGLEDMKGI